MDTGEAAALETLKETPGVGVEMGETREVFVEAVGSARLVRSGDIDTSWSSDGALGDERCCP